MSKSTSQPSHIDLSDWNQHWPLNPHVLTVPQVLEKQTLVTQTTEHRYPYVHPCISDMWRDPLVWILAFWIWPQHKGRSSIPLLWQKRNQIYHQVAGVTPAACRVSAAVSNARGRAHQADSVTLCLRLWTESAKWPFKKCPKSNGIVFRIEP